MIEQDEMKGGVKVCELVEHLGLAVVNKGADFETALVGIRDVNRPGLQLVGFFDYFDPRRLQVIGMKVLIHSPGGHTDPRFCDQQVTFVHRRQGS